MNDHTMIIGDVHGCYEELLSLVEKTPKSVERIILIGDLINKGPKSLEVLQLVRQKNYESLIGNHELKFLRCLDGRSKWTPELKVLKERMGSDLERWAHWISNLPKYIEAESFLAVHAGLVPGQHPKDSNIDILANIRTWDGHGLDLTSSNNPPWYEYYTGKKLVVYGHWAMQGLKLRDNTVGLDSGCVYGKKLSALLLPSRSILQVPAAKAYCSYT